MKTDENARICVFMMMFLLLFPAATRGDGAVGFARIDRSSIGQSGELDGDEQQHIAQLTGYGEFLVGTAKICFEDDGSPLARCRVFSFFVPGDVGSKTKPYKRILHDGRNAISGQVVGSDVELIGYCLKRYSCLSRDEKTLGRLMSGIITATVYAGQARACITGFPPFFDEGRAGGRTGNLAENAELRSLSREQSVLFGADGGIEWSGRFLLDDGSVEDVNVAISPVSDRLVQLKRIEVRPRNYFQKVEDGSLVLEQWIVSNESNWLPPRHLSFTYTLASLGNTTAKYQLGLALMEAADEISKAEGLRWLRAAAADGNVAAAKSLSVFETDSRNTKGREALQKTSCCRILPRR